MVYPAVRESNVLDNKLRMIIYTMLKDKGPLNCYGIKKEINAERKKRGIKKAVSFQLIWYHVKMLEKFGKVRFDHAEEFGERGEMSRVEIDKIFYKAI